MHQVDLNRADMDRDRLAHVLQGFPAPLVEPDVFRMLDRYYADLDAIGRIDDETGEPLIDKVQLTALLREFVNLGEADRLVKLLEGLQGAAFRTALGRDRYREVSWFELAREIVIFDTEPKTTFEQLRLSSRATPDEVIDAVQARFPSLEREMADPTILGDQVIKRLSDPQQAEAALHIINKQLGWWAALATVLLLPPAIAARRHVSDPKTAAVAWPLSMNVLGAAVGGWTITVVGSCLLAPLQ